MEQCGSTSILKTQEGYLVGRGTNVFSPNIHVISLGLTGGEREPVPEHVLYCLGTFLLGNLSAENNW
jgi:hypothetical protein